MYMTNPLITVCMAKQVLYPVDDFITYLRTPVVQAFLDTIAYAEGTLNSAGYKTQYTYKYFNNFSDHPREVICKEYKGTMLCSSAAGRYQFLQKTWDGVAPLIDAHDFSPLNQDLGAIALLHQQEIMPLVLTGQFEPAIAKAKGIWASLPESPYGQPTRNLPELKAVFDKQLKYHGRHRRFLQRKYPRTTDKRHKEPDLLAKRGFFI